VLPFGTISFGNRTINVAFLAGYGAICQDGGVEGRAMMSLAGMIKISPKISLVFDSFILLPETNTGQSTTRSGFVLFISGLMWHQSEGKAVQFGFSGIYSNNDFIPIPIPMV
jgi:hypothetical protein